MALIKRLILPLQYLTIGIFFILLPLLFLYCRIRYFLKRVFKKKPNILFSFLGIQINFLTAKAVKTQGFSANVYMLSCAPFVENICWGFNLKKHFILRYLVYLTDYTLIFIWACIFYDIFEFNFRGGLLMHSHLQKIEPQLLKILAKKVVIYGYGSDCKILSDVKKQAKYNNAMDRDGSSENINDNITRKNVERAKRYANVLIAGGDLIHFGSKGIFMPLAFDLKPWKFKALKKKKIITIIHSTNHRSHKGSRFIIEAMEKLQKNGLPINFNLIEGKSYKNCRKLYYQGDIFITDVITGWHGLTACEAMALGRPVIAYLRPDIKPFHNYYAKDIPVVSANPDNLEKQVKKLVSDFKLRRELGQRGRQYVIKYHFLDFVGALRAVVYDFIWQNKKINQKIFEQEIKRRKVIV
ncbi:MAG: Glycosyltransferase [Berkelbacteria bacterium GW2011_GWA1_36_9]|uniref:Glycosyltransferase n=1 Tax=Berkelbacteria bacterium GW2011_GWA1_36_9 TaxID=1618331 RepID=A0A0G0FI83_9BACT|nr:MAG: Glycosyltransferase [Berkelbacteria bacterium GW2011_GWA1_36_9]